MRNFRFCYLQHRKHLGLFPLANLSYGCKLVILVCGPQVVATGLLTYHNLTSYAVDVCTFLSDTSRVSAAR